MPVIYTITSLSDLARLFEEHSERCLKNSTRTATLKEKALLKRESITWDAAATIVRQTVMGEDKLPASDKAPLV